MHLKKGFTFIEILISVLIVGLVSVGLVVVLYEYKFNEVKNEELLFRIQTVQTAYELFNDDPENIGESLEKTFHGEWEQNFYHVIGSNVYFELEIIFSKFYLRVYYGNKLQEEWVRCLY